ncbi:MAG: hypothetical protein K9N55_09110 [Phycisphaerae bacterium]|nr:hypothetical protein [Phycisphaerae bacterium]
MHVLPGGKRSDKVCFLQGRFTKAQPKVTLALSRDDAAYVVVINHGSPTQSFTLDVREADVTLPDVLHQITRMLFSFEDPLLGKIDVYFTPK